MAYYIRHFFDPDFSHEHLRPSALNDGDVSQHYLGYVQNVVAGQVLAEVIDLDEHPEISDYDPRFVFPERIFPCGPNCVAHPEFPLRILAQTSGYVFYHQGLITVKRLLNVRRDVDFHTGNIMFAGNIVAHGAVRSGFTLLGGKVLVKGTVEGATIITEDDLVCESGVKGGNQGDLICGGNLKINFCENARIHVQGNMEIEGSSLHSELYVCGNLMIKGRLQGGTVCANNVVYITEQLGGGQNTVTRIIMGYNPKEYRLLKTLKKDIAHLQTCLGNLELLVKKKPIVMDDYATTIRLLREKIAIKQKRYKELQDVLENGKVDASQCRIICPGRVKPGVEISIADADISLQDFFEAVEFRLVDKEVTYNSITK
jgi:uncharacterized protein (DUF342 family)